MNSDKKSFAKWLQMQRNLLAQDGAKDAQVVSESSDGINPKLIEKARDEMKRMLLLPGNNEPVRGDLDKAEIEWRCGKPNYTIANLAYLKGKCQSHENGSLEMIVENAVKTVKASLILKT